MNKPEPRTILFLDDDISLLNALRRRMRKEGFSCFFFQSPEKMLSAAGKGEACLLVSDIHMPGVDLLRCLKEFRAACSGGKILLLSGDRDSVRGKEIAAAIPVMGIISKTDHPVEEILRYAGKDPPENRMEPEQPPRQEEDILILDRDIESLIPGFLEERRRMCARIQTALGKGDFSGIGQIGHKIKGSGLLYGFGRISEWGEKIEAAAAEGQETVISRSVSELLIYLDTVRYDFR